MKLEARFKTKTISRQGNCNSFDGRTIDIGTGILRIGDPKNGQKEVSNNATCHSIARFVAAHCSFAWRRNSESVEIRAVA